MSSFFAADKPLNRKQLTILLNLRYGLEVGLKNKILNRDEESKNIINEYYKSSHTKTVDEGFFTLKYLEDNKLIKNYYLIKIKVYIIKLQVQYSLNYSWF